LTVLQHIGGEPKPEALKGAGAGTRRLGLLAQVAEAGGVITPVANPLARRGYEYSPLGDDAEADLLDLAKRGYLEARFFDRVSLCPKCASHHLNVREICPACRSSHLTSEGLLHHFRCGNIGLPSEFASGEDGSYLCPKCKRKMYHLGTEYDRLGRAFVCHACARISDNPPIEAVCLACGQRTPADDLVSTELFSYVLTSRGAAAIRSGSLLDDGGEEPVSIAGAPVYRRSVILEFLGHELKRLEHFHRGFSVLLIEHGPATAGRPGGDSVTPWLSRLRECLREIDLIGQLADALYVVVLPQTKRRDAEALCESVTAKLGPESPLALTAVEITKPPDLAAILTRRDGPDRKS
jgi:hypothetical protein